MKIKDLAKALNFGEMDLCTEDNGKMTSGMDLEDSLDLMELSFTKDSGQMMSILADIGKRKQKSIHIHLFKYFVKLPNDKTKGCPLSTVDLSAPSISPRQD